MTDTSQQNRFHPKKTFLSDLTIRYPDCITRTTDYLTMTDNVFSDKQVEELVKKTREGNSDVNPTPASTYTYISLP